MMGMKDPSFTIGSTDCPDGVMCAFIPNGTFSLFIVARNLGMEDTPYGPAIVVDDGKIELMISTN